MDGSLTWFSWELLTPGESYSPEFEDGFYYTVNEGWYREVCPVLREVGSVESDAWIVQTCADIHGPRQTLFPGGNFARLFHHELGAKQAPRRLKW